MTTTETIRADTAVPYDSMQPPAVKKRKSLAKREQRAAYLFLLPWFIGLFGITLGPMLVSLYLSFTNFSIVGAYEWVGLDNYVRIFTADPRFYQAVTVTVVYVFVSVPLVLIFSLGLALILNKGLRFLPLYRSLFYLPSLIGGSVAMALLWRQVFGSDGLVNQFLGIFGIQGPSWLGNPDTALWTLITLNVWTFGAAMVIFLAGLRQIPSEYYESASIDGAGRVRQFKNITLPLLTPVILFNTVLNVINAFQAFTPAYIIGGGRGEPNDSTLFYTLYLYQMGFGQFQMGYASALAWILLIGIMAVTGLFMLTSGRWVFYSDGK